MANRYWVGGTAAWDATAGTKWALTSGGAGGQAVPTSADDVFFDAASGASTVTIGASTAICSTLTMTGFTGTLAFGTNSIDLAGTGAIYTGAVGGTLVTGTPLMLCTNATATARTINASPNTNSEANAVSFNITNGSGPISWGTNQGVKNITFSGTFTGSTSGGFYCYGNLTLKTGMTVSAGGAGISFVATSGTQLITSSGISFDQPINFSGTSTYSLQDALVTGSTRSCNLSSGTLITNGYNLTCGTFNYNNVNTKALNLGTSTITILGGSSTSGFVGSNAGTTYTDILNSTIVFTSTSTTCFSGGQSGGGGTQFGTITLSGVGGTLVLGLGVTVAQCTTLNNTVSPYTITNSCTTAFTVTNFNVDGTAGNLVTLNSLTPGTARSISQASGTVNAQYMSIKDSTATGGATWNASNSVAGPNNTGWNFLASTSRLRLISTGIMYTVTAELDEVTTPNISMSLSKFNSTEFDEGGYNLYLNTVDFNATSWSFNNGTITRNTTVAPNGTTTAATITGSSATVPYLSSSESIVSGTTYTFSVYAQAGTQSRVMMLLYGVNFNNGGANQSVTFDLSLGTIISTAASPQGYGIQFIGSGWYRIYITGTATTTTADNTQLVRFQDGIYVSGNYAYVWGPQCEPGTQPNFYVPTTTTISIPPPMRYTNGNIVQVSTEFDEVTTIS